MKVGDILLMIMHRGERHKSSPQLRSVRREPKVRSVLLLKFQLQVEIFCTKPRDVGAISAVVKEPQSGRECLAYRDIKQISKFQFESKRSRNCVHIDRQICLILIIRDVIIRL